MIHNLYEVLFSLMNTRPHQSNLSARGDKKIKRTEAGLTEETSSGEIEHFRKGLNTEGFSDLDIPLGWMRKWGKGSRSWMWVAPDFSVIRNQKELVMHLEGSTNMERGSLEVGELVDVLMGNPPIEQTLKPATKAKGDFDFAWREAEPSDILPEGWKVIATI